MAVNETCPTHMQGRLRSASNETSFMATGVSNPASMIFVLFHQNGEMSWITWALLSAVFAAATAVLAKLGVAGMDSNFATAIRTTVVVVFTWLLAYVARSAETFHVPSNRTWLFLVLSGLATGLSWLCYFRALQLGPASRVAPVDKLSVALVIVFSALFLGERITLSKGVGGLLIVAGAIVIIFD